MGALLSVVDPKIPPTWLDRFVHSLGRASIGTFARHLPPKVREAAVGLPKQSRNCTSLEIRSLRRSRPSD